MSGTGRIKYKKPPFLYPLCRGCGFLHLRSASTGIEPAGFKCGHGIPQCKAWHARDALERHALHLSTRHVTEAPPLDSSRDRAGEGAALCGCGLMCSLTAGPQCL
eukprot:3938779-Rhodomonas_salina.1